MSKESGVWPDGSSGPKIAQVCPCCGSMPSGYLCAHGLLPVPLAEPISTVPVPVLPASIATELVRAIEFEVGCIRDYADEKPGLLGKLAGEIAEPLEAALTKYHAALGEEAGK